MHESTSPSIPLISAVRLIGNCALNEFLLQSRIQIVFTEGRSVGESEPIHKFCCRKGIVSKNRQKTCSRCFILVGHLVAILVGGATNNRHFL